MTACGPDLLELDPQEPSDLTVAQLVAKMNHATDPRGNYRDAKTYMMKQDLSSVKPGKKEYYATEIQFKAPDKMRTTTYRDGKAIAAVIFNGEQGWNVDLLKNRSEKLKPGLPLSLVCVETVNVGAVLSKTAARAKASTVALFCVSITLSPSPVVVGLTL